MKNYKQTSVTASSGPHVGCDTSTRTVRHVPGWQVQSSGLSREETRRIVLEILG